MNRLPTHPQLHLLRELRALHLRQLNARPRKLFRTGLSAIDSLLPDAGFARGAIHELLSDPAHPAARTFALLLARAAAAAENPSAHIVWSDPRRELYPPALAAAGLPLDRLLLLRPATPADELWATAECLACRGIAATIAAPPRLTRVEARRLQLAAERGGGAGILLRPAGPASAHYAAASRWLIRPAPGDDDAQRWQLQLIHGHGGLIGKTILLEISRDPHSTHPLRAIEELADRPAAAVGATRASA